MQPGCDGQTCERGFHYRPVIEVRLRDPVSPDRGKQYMDDGARKTARKGFRWRQVIQVLPVLNGRVAQPNKKKRK